MAKITPSQGEILAHFKLGETYTLTELAAHFQTSKSLLQLALSKMPRIQNFGGAYKLVADRGDVPVYMSPPLDLRRFYSPVIGRVAEYRAIPSVGGD